MHLVIISGFLGSGKTTLLLALAKQFSQQGKKLAIIENEIGSVGVDDATLREEGLTVKEIYSGCICCSLRMDLVSALLEIEREYNPDVVILEPSGVAGPKQVLGALTGYGGEIASKRLLSVVDASRFEAIQDMSIPLVTDGIEVADIVLINKIDLVSASDISTITKAVHTVREDALIVPMSASSGSGVNDVVDALSLPVTARDHSEAEEKSGPRPVVHAITLELDSPPGPKQLVCEWTGIIDSLASHLQSAGCTLIGHVKAIIKSDKGGYLVISRTDFSNPSQTKGRLPSSFGKLSVTVNAIVYGITKDALISAVNQALTDDKNS